jgi:hypothetical protein
MRMNRRLAALVLVVAVGGTALACSASDDKSSSGSSSDAMHSTGAAVAADSAAPEAAVAQSAGGQTAGQTPSFAIDAVTAPPGEVGRDVVSSATVTVRAEDIAAAKEQAAAAVEAAGGFVFAEQGQFGDNPSATLTLKVPPQRFRSLLAGLGRLGTVERQDVTTDDVTEQVIDLDSRIASAEVSVARVRSFLDRATNVIEISSFESELLRRETDLEKLRGQKRSLDGRIDLATIVLTVQPPVPVAEPTPSEPTELPGFLEGLAAGWRVFLGVATVLLAVLGALVPFAPLVAVGGAVLWWTRRRTRTAQGTV